MLSEPLEPRRLLASIVVNHFADNTAAGDGLVTLREAIIAANNDASTDLEQTGNGPDEITFDPAVFSIPRTINLNSQLPDLNTQMSIVGRGASLLTIDGGGAYKAMSNFSLVTLSGVTIAHGKDASGGALLNTGTMTITDCVFTQNVSTASGGAIQNSGILTISNSVISDNTASTSNGGGIAVASGVAFISNTVFSGNSALISGACYGLVVVSKCTFNSNTAAGSGGAIFAQYGSEIRDSTFNDNGAVLAGAVAIASGSGGPYTRISSCTFAGNHATDGGAIFSRGTFELTRSTLSANSASDSGGAVYVYESDFVSVGNTLSGNVASIIGGGIFRRAGNILMRHNVVAMNAAPTDADVSGPYASDYSFIGGDPKLGPLQDNGGPTLTMLPLDGSPLINAGDPSFNPLPGETDQRGTGFARVLYGRVDIGAVEWHASNTPPTTIGIPNVVVDEDAANTMVTLSNYFSDVETPADLAYSVFSQSGTAGLFSSTAINGGQLTLDYAANKSGLAAVTIRATDPQGGYVDATFTVTVLSAAQQANILSVQIQALAGMNKGNANSLMSKLSLKGNNGDIGKVNALTSEVEGMLKAGMIGKHDAEQLLAGARALLLSVA